MFKELKARAEHLGQISTQMDFTEGMSVRRNNVKMDDRKIAEVSLNGLWLNISINVGKRNIM